MQNYLSELDTKRFGFKVAKINDFNDFNNSPVFAMEELKKIGVRLVISRVSSGDIETINHMEDAGYRLKDVQAIYTYDLDSGDTPLEGESKFAYRKSKIDDIEDIVRIAGESFKKYGHYSKNEKLNLIDTGSIYADWAQKCCTDSDYCDHIIVAELDGVVAGFLTFKIRYDDHLKYASAFLGAVRKDFRNDGVFRGINIAGLNWAKNENVNKVETSVLITNFPVNKTYAALGFRITRSETTLHCWLG